MNNSMTPFEIGDYVLVIGFCLSIIFWANLFLCYSFGLLNREDQSAEETQYEDNDE